MSKDKRRKEVRLAQIVSKADCEYGYFCVNLNHGGPRYTRETKECVEKGYLKRVKSLRHKWGGRQHTMLYLMPKGKAFLRRQGYILYEDTDNHSLETILRFSRHMPAYAKRIIAERYEKKKN